MTISHREARRQLEQFLTALFRTDELIELRFIESWVSGGQKEELRGSTAAVAAPSGLRRKAR